MSDEEGDHDDALGPPATEQTAEDLRKAVEEKYDFDNFGPKDMERMSYEEWDAAFDEDTWITGPELLDRVESDLNAQIANRDVFAVLERVRHEGQNCLLAYSDEGYAMVYPDGSVDGFGTVVRDVKPTVALCSMDSYDPATAPAGAVLPHPDEVPEGSGQLGNWMLQAIAFTLGLCGLALFGASVFATPPAELGNASLARGVMILMGIVFTLGSALLFLTVANARLSDRFRASEYKERLRAIGLEDGERPDFLPVVERSASGDERDGRDTVGRGGRDADGRGGRDTDEQTGPTVETDS
ncbi:DUF7319 domain-containing protein [Haloarchaeobius sp. TZWWS8]|uniref:DUF7319 domain-containing protein n=1 Tax=Haloarchaeobius sp. TZWWS8 TaxID=3446121 RepID=UPI003EBA62A7